jgi:hypothetical protein
VPGHPSWHRTSKLSLERIRSRVETGLASTTVHGRIYPKEFRIYEVLWERPSEEGYRFDFILHSKLGFPRLGSACTFHATG